MKEFWNADRTIYPAVFRLLIGLLLLFDLSFLYSSAPVWLNPEFNALLPEDNLSVFVASHYQYFFLIYGVLLLCFMLGLFKNLTAFLVWLFYMLFFHLGYQFMTWGDTILKFSLLYFVFADSFRFLSVSRTKGKLPLICVLAIWSVIMHLFMVYLNNAFFKLGHIHWQQGVAVYYSFAQYPDFENSWLYPLISDGFFSRFIAYFIMLQQLLFVPFVLWKKTRYFMLILALLIHLLMMIAFELWKFELIVILHYGFLLNDKDLRRLLPFKYFQSN